MDARSSTSHSLGLHAAKRRACVTCTNAKAKCTRRSTEDDCERCARLGKSCTYLDLPQRRRRQQGTRRIEGLETRLEELATRVSTFHKDESFVGGSTMPGVAPSGHLAAPLVPPAPPVYIPPSVNTISSRIRQSLAPPTPVTLPNIADGYVDLVERRIITMEYAQLLLNNFNIQYAPLFPFVVLDNEVDANNLRQNASLLFLVVISVALRSDPSLQRLLGEEIRAQINSRLIGRGERSLEALQALLVYLAWRYCFASPGGEPEMFTMVQLCAAMVWDLGLDKRSGTSSAKKRALLGVYWLSSGLSRSLRRPPVMRISGYMADCSRNLDEAREYSTDRHIQPLVLLAALAGRVEETFSYFDVEYSSVRGNSSVLVTADEFLHQLKLIREFSVFDDWTPDKIMIQLELLYTESYILEVALHGELWERAPNRSSGTRTGRILTLPSRTSSRDDMMQSILSCNDAFVEEFLATEDSTVRCVPYTICWRMCYVLASYIRLTFTLVERTKLSDRPPAARVLFPAETRRTPQQIADEIDFPKMLGDLIWKFECAAQSPGVEAARANDNLAPFINKMKKLLPAFSKKLRDALGGGSTAAVETELMDCQRGATEQPNGDTLGDSAQLRPVEAPNEGAEGILQRQDWPPLGEFAGPELVDWEWEAILKEFTIPG